MNTPGKTPLVVDLDGTLARTDFLFESFLLFLKQNPLNIFRVAYWVATQNREHLKAKIAKAVDIDASTIPYNQELVGWLQDEKNSGREIVLATASYQKYADAVAAHLGLFDEVLASNEAFNLKGPNKERVLVEKYGSKGFVYAGDSRADLNVWRSAESAVTVNVTGKLKHRVEQLTPISRAFGEGFNFSDAFRAIRVHQWVKNLLVFVPLFTSHTMGNLNASFSAVLAFVAFSLCASSVYIVNDFFDLADDRNHSTKRNRPFASGDLSIIHGVGLVLVCLLSALVIAAMISIEFLCVLLGYFLLTGAYTLYFKHRMMLDIVMLAGLYTLRIVAGAVVIHVALSSWLLAFSLFFFLSLAVMKRYIELLSMHQAGKPVDAKARDYFVSDLSMLGVLGATSGYISVLIMALYVNSQAVTELYHKPQILWVVCPVFLFWIGRVWVLASRGLIDDDPIEFVIKDKASWLTGLLVLVIFWAAT